MSLDVYSEHQPWENNKELLNLLEAYKELQVIGSLHPSFTNLNGIPRRRSLHRTPGH